MPGRKRKRSKKAASSKEPTVDHAGCPQAKKKYKQWNNEAMLGAMKAVSEGTGVNRAALEFGVPKSTLKDRVAGKVQHGSKSGKTPYLTHDEEKELVDFLISSSKIGYPKRRDDVIGIVRRTLEKKNGGLEDFTGKGWWARFMERWPMLSLRKGDSLAQPRANAVTQENIKEYYALLLKTLEKFGLLDCPSKLFNMDESGMPLDHKPPKVVSLKGAKKVYCRTSGNKSQITILACASASGYVIPPMVIFEGKRLNPEWTKGEVPNTLYGMSDKGWTDMELFNHWLTKLFLPNIPPARPVMLFLDGHSSHYEPDTIRLAMEENVVVFCLPPHTTHVSQPLDISFFRPLKSYWSNACHEYIQKNPGRIITKYQFSPLFSDAWYKAIKPANIIGGFRGVGIYPFNSAAITIPETPPSSSTSDPEPVAVAEDVTSPEPSGATTSKYSEEELERFNTRFENG